LLFNSTSFSHLTFRGSFLGAEHHHSLSHSDISGSGNTSISGSGSGSTKFTIMLETPNSFFSCPNSSFRITSIG
jgi:hypothetical protein